jgi:hypothetical protein
MSRNSAYIQKLALSPRVLVQSEVEIVALEMYTLMDKGVSRADAYKSVLAKYSSDEIHHKLHEKSGCLLFKALEDLDTTRLLFPLTDDLLSEDAHVEPVYTSLDAGFYGEGQWFPSTEPNVYSVKNGLARLSEKFDDFPFKPDGVDGYFVLAGGAVLRELTENRMGFSHSDNDFFMITRNKYQACKMIQAVYGWIDSKPEFSNFYITRTNHTVTFVTENEVFQIILRLYHDVFQALSGFDLDPSCLAYDGERVLTIGRGLDCLKSNSFPLLSWKQSETMPWRCKKMRFRRFSITIPGLTDAEFEACKSVCDSVTLLQKIVNYKGYKGFDYEDTIKHSSIDSVRLTIHQEQSDTLHVVTRDLKVIFDTQNKQIDDEFTVVNWQKSNIIQFVTKMAHGQATGSFKPTSEDFFLGIKW